jgi:RNA polymerase sigma-70 factor (ECF subfamily)
VTKTRQSEGPELWHRIRAGESDAFIVLYEETSDAVFGFCLRRTGSWESAQDCTSLVFLETWRLRSTLRETSSGMAWLFGIANNVLRNSSRARRRHTDLLRRLPLHEVEHGFENEAAERVDAEQQLKRVLRVLNRLPARERDVISLATWAQLDTAGIADALEIPAGTVKSRLSRARRKLVDLSGEESSDAPDGITDLDQLGSGVQR